MIKFIKNNSRKLYIIGSAILVLMIAVLGVMIAGEFGKNVNAANTHTVTVAKTSTVTVYVSGKGVTYDPSLSTDNTEVYHVEEDTSITLRAVNESRVFTNWKITGGYDKVDNAAVLTDKLFEITPTTDITIDTEKKNALLADYGEYMNASFMITLDTHLMYLQKIFEAGPVLANVANKDVLDAYDYFFEKYSTYETNILPISNTTQAEAKATAIINNGLFAKIQNGYYKIGSSFSLLDENFKGIGNETYPFKGIFCGNSNSTKATIFVTASGTETSGDMLRGLFQITDPEAVIRNVNIRISLGVKANASTAATNIYAGGVAGKVNKSVISNVDVLARIAVDATSANIYAGGVAGELAGGLDDSRNVLINGKDSTFILTTYASEKNIYSGLVSGNATNVYVKEANIDTSSFAISAKNTASNTYNNNTNVYLGNLFGKYTATSAMPIENVKISGSSKESITSLISSGNSYIGGLIGHLTVSSGSVNLGDVSIKNTSGESKLSASSVDKNSQTNLLTAGLIACVVGNNLNAKEEFLDGVKTKVVDGVTHYEYEYIFNTDLLIQSVNNGQGNGSTFGKTMATGFIARGYMNLNGNSDTNRNEIFLSSGKYKTKVYATQTSTSAHTAVDQTTGAVSNGANDKEHCLATAFYGNINRTGFTMQNINVYASNYDIAATRELGSYGMGDVHAAGFIAYTSNVNLTNLTMYLNDSYIKGHSLSYEVHNSRSGINNCYVGGFIGAFDGTSAEKANLVDLTNITFAGHYDHLTKIESGTTSKIEGTQNTYGASDYTNENYVGGIVGRMYLADANGLYYVGSPSDEDIIISLTHEDPASAFCGGVIGSIRNNVNLVIDLENIEISNASVHAAATVEVNVGSWPDIYIGGILGAIYHDTSGGTLNLSNSKVINTSVKGEGNEMIMLYVGGVIGTATWSGETNISDVYVVNSNIESHLKVNTNFDFNDIASCAAGIMGRTNSNTDIENCAVIDCSVDSSYVNTYSTTKTANTSSSGIFGDREGDTIEIINCYSNSSLTSTGGVYGIARAYTDTSATNSYYVEQNAGGVSGLGTALDFSNKPVNATNTLLFTSGTGVAQLPSTAAKYFIDLENTTDFTVGSNTDDELGVRYNTGVTDKSSFADIWINAKDGGDTNDPSDYATEAELINAGWFKLGNVIVYTGDASDTITISSPNYSFIGDGSEYVLQADGTFKNKNYPYDEIDNVGYTVGTTGSEELDGTTVTLTNIIDVNVVSNMKQIKIKFNLSPADYYPVLFDSAGKVISSNGLVNDEYGKFDFTINGTEYTITYEPNESINHDDTFFIGFVNGKDEVLTTSAYQFDINYNAATLVGLIYADYTKPINYQEITFSNNATYKLRASKIIKILPVFEMKNEPGKYVISELNVSKVTYETSNANSKIKSNGELTAPGSGTGTVTVTYTENSTTQTKTISFSVVSEVSVTYTSVGAEVEALNYATTDNDYYMDVDLLDHYGGVPVTFNVKYEGTPDEHIFVSPLIPTDATKLVLTLGGATGTIEFYVSDDNGRHWTKENDINVTSTSYSEYEINVEGKNYTNFKLVNPNHTDIGINSYTVMFEPIEVNLTSDVQNSDLDGTTVVDTSGKDMFTMTNATVTRDETTINGTNINGLNFRNSKTTLTGFPYNANNEQRYTAVTVNYSGTGKVTLYGMYAEYQQNWFGGGSYELTNTWEELTVLSDNVRYTGMTNQNNNKRLVQIMIVIEGEDNFSLDSISYNVRNNNNDNGNNTNASFNSIAYEQTKHSDNYILVNGDATFTFNRPLQELPVIVSEGTINGTPSYSGSTYSISGTNLKISSVNAKVIDYNSTTYTFNGTSTISQAGFTNGSQTLQASINGCSTSGTNLLLNGTGYYTYDKDDLAANGWITPSAWDVDATHYTLKVPQSVIQAAPVGSSIIVDIEFPVVYTISFALQSDSFNPDYTGKTEFSYKVEAGTTFTELFGTPTSPTENYNELLDALKPELYGGVKKFGFVFGGFYLIDSGNSLDAYSMSFEELLEKQGGLEIYSSYHFFGRWSFLIEHIEAPGTEIKTSFEPGFMEKIGLTEEEREELELNDSITIPINNNRGYVFTVEKEEGFIGEAQVNAYIVANEHHIDKNGDGECDICNNPAEEIKSDHIREITIQKYHDNMYLYFIPAEEITGYLVIVSNVTNSSIIVGKNTASVTEQILPEDGIYTFKYVVNHKDGESYIYDSTANLLNIKRNIMIEFFTQVYDEDTKATDVEERKLPVGTVIEVYYSLYEDGVLTDQTIGVYKTTSADESKVYLDQFKKWNQTEDAFSNITFATLLSNNTSTSEVYYFVVTPPNGTDTRRSTSGNEIINEAIYVGYCNEAKTDYISGMRNDDDIINQPIEDIVEGVATKESSKNEKIYSVTPSRVTSLTKTDNNNYTFTDITTYHVIDLDISNGSITDGKIVLSDNATNDTIITSSSIKGKIREIGLELGFGTGLVEVLGSTDGLSWTPIATFLVDDVDYKYYYVDFEAKGNNFTHFKVDNKSLGEMRLASFSYNTISNAMEYKYSISEGELDGNTLSFVNEIKGDTRHDGKTFMLAVEYTGVVNISTNVSITVTYNGGSDTIKPLLSERAGKVVAYYNLSQILKDKNVTTINITLNNDSHSVEKVRLLEATSASKPAVSEERVVYPKN